MKFGRAFTPTAYPRAPAFVAERRDAVPGGVSSQLAHLTAWASFFAFCVERGLLDSNPLTSGAVAWLRDPARNRKVRDQHIARLADVQRFAAAMPTVEDRAIAALREGVGAD
jgi:site-specific recombinase XerC